MFWAMVHGHYISIEKREKQSHSCVEVTVVIPPHKEEREPLEQMASYLSREPELYLDFFICSIAKQCRPLRVLAVVGLDCCKGCRRQVPRLTCFWSDGLGTLTTE